MITRGLLEISDEGGNQKYCECDFKRALGTNSSLELKRRVDKNRYNITFYLNKQYNEVRDRLLVLIVFFNKMEKNIYCIVFDT